MRRTGTAPLAGQTFRVGFTDGDFLGMLGIELVAGRTFPDDYGQFTGSG